MVDESPMASGIRMAFITACVAGIMSGGWLALLGVVALTGMAVKTYTDIKRETQIEPEWEQPPVKYETCVQEPGEFWQQTVDGRGKGRER